MTRQGLTTALQTCDFYRHTYLASKSKGVDGHLASTDTVTGFCLASATVIKAHTSNHHIYIKQKIRDKQLQNTNDIICGLTFAFMYILAI